MDAKRVDPDLGKAMKRIVSGKYGLAYCLGSSGWKYQGMTPEEVLEAFQKE
jgi:hypothetical protein